MYTLRLKHALKRQILKNMSEILNTTPITGSDIDLNLLERALSSRDVELRPKYARLITQLLKVHETGMLHYSVSSNSFELRIPDPNLLIEDGFKELNSKHLYINLTKYLEQQHIAPARCVKNGKVYTMLELLNMKPLRQRQDEIPWDIEKFLNKYKQKTLIIPRTSVSIDPNFKVEPPGECIKVTDLPSNHPAVLYLKDRGFATKQDLENLVNQFNLSFCIKSNYRNYTDQYMGLSKSPEGRLVFFIYQFGELKGWQARRLEKREGDTIYHYHLDAFNALKTGWIPVGKYDYTINKIKPLPDVPKAVFDSKYVIGFGTKASQLLLGFDAALEFNKNKINKSVVIVEGALDAGKFGAPACSSFGCHISKSQAQLIANNFDRIYLIRDHDLAGEELYTSLTNELFALGIIKEIKEITYPKIYKDIGEINDKELLNKLRNELNG